MSRWWTPSLLFVLWIALWGELSVANVVSGAVVIGALFGVWGRPSAATIRPLAAVRLGFVFLWLLVQSSVAMAVTVVRPTPARLRAGIVAVPTTLGSNAARTLLADLITLTPGTLTVEVGTWGEVPALFVHVLGLTDPDDLRAEVARLEALVAAAVEPAGGGPR